MVAFLLSATPGAAETEFGAFGGANISTLQRSPEPVATRTESRTGFLVGGVVDLSLGDRVGLRLEPAYIEKGTKLIIGSEGGPTTRAETVLGFVEVPVLLRAAVIQGRAGLYAGPTNFQGYVIALPD